jgi:magnesium chelatase family protein
VLENLRQPLEDGVVSISRAQGTLSFPARFTLVASQNPCPCGYASDPEKNCLCAPGQILKYQKRISGPILDRIDLHIEVPRLDYEKMQATEQKETSHIIKMRVIAAQAKQYARFANTETKYNAEMTPAEIKAHCELDSASSDLLKNAVTQLHLSARTFHRLLKVGRTIADLDNVENIQTSHLAEALQYRTKQQ